MFRPNHGVVGDEVERRIDVLGRYALPLRIGEPVERKLQLLRFEVGRISWGSPCFPVDNLEAIAIGIYGIDLADNDAVAEGDVDLDLTVDGFARGPRRTLEGRLQLGELFDIRRILAFEAIKVGAVDLESESVKRLDSCRRAEA